MREQLLKELYQLRKGGWEKPVLPYGIPFREESANDHELEAHVYKIKNYKREQMHSRIVITLQLLGLILLMIIIIANSMMK